MTLLNLYIKEQACDGLTSVFIYFFIQIIYFGNVYFDRFICYWRVLNKGYPLDGDS